MKSLKKNAPWIALALAAVVSIGCGGDPVTAMPTAGTANGLQPVPQGLANAAAGVKVDPTVDAAVIASWVSSKQIRPRPDPFALLAAERKFEADQQAANLLQMSGNFPMVAQPTPVSVPPAVIPEEPQPYRRLAGILIGETITALIDMGDGRGLQTIRPGMRIPNTEWMVQSIDSEKAILRRIPGVKKRPTEVVVRLESPPPGFAPNPTPQQDQGNPPADQGGTPPGFEFDDR